VVRRQWLESMDDFSGVLQIVGRLRDPEAFQIRDFLNKNHIPHAFIDVEGEEGGAILDRFDLSKDGPGDLPAVINGRCATVTHCRWRPAYLASSLPVMCEPAQPNGAQPP
jgi:hypothetical protein